ncbi:MAG: dienelactone hydrolase family protein [Actinomycetota bacterium]
MRVYEAVTERAARGAVVVIQEAFGLNGHIEDVTRRFAAAGYYSVAPDLFHRAGGGVAEYGDFETVMKLYEGLTSDEPILVDVDAALAVARAAGFDDASIGIVGFCFGGRVTFLTALEHAIGAAVGFYGGGIVTGRFPQFPTLLDRAATLRTPWLGLFGDLDTSIPVEDVDTLRSALETAPVATEVVRYPEAKHGFHCDVRADYDPAAAADAWARTLAWFDRHLA